MAQRGDMGVVKIQSEDDLIEYLKIHTNKIDFIAQVVSGWHLKVVYSFLLENNYIMNQ